MTVIFKNRTFKKFDSSTFGGIVYDSDFNTNFKKESISKHGSDIASRILRDRKFDEQCKKQYRLREYNNK